MSNTFVRIGFAWVLIPWLTECEIAGGEHISMCSPRLHHKWFQTLERRFSWHQFGESSGRDVDTWVEVMTRIPSQPSFIAALGQ